MQKSLYKKPIDKLYCKSKEWSKSRTAKKRLRTMLKIDSRNADSFDNFL